MNEKSQKDDQEDELLLIEFISRKGKIFKNCLATAITRIDESTSLKIFLSTNSENMVINAPKILLYRRCFLINS